MEVVERVTFGPLDGFMGVCFLGHLFDLPWTPYLVAEGPVFDLMHWSVLILWFRDRGVTYIVWLFAAILAP